MSGKWKARLLVGLLVVVAGAGCNPIQLYSLLVYGGKGSEILPEYPLPAHGEDAESVKLVLMVSTPGHVASEFIGVDRTFATMMEKDMNRWFAESDEQVIVVPRSEVETYLRTQTRMVEPAEIGEHFQADYVIDVELIGLGMFEPGSHQLYNGKAEISVVVHDIIDGGGDPLYAFDYPTQYPSYAPIMRSSDTPPTIFRQKFLRHMATQLAWKFAPHLREDERDVSGSLR